MFTRRSHHQPIHGFRLRHLADGVRGADGIVGRALARYAGTVPDDTMARLEVVASHLHGLQGWAKVSAALPPAAERTEPFAIGWRLVDELLLLLLRGDTDTNRAAAIWHRLATEMPDQTTTILCDIYRAGVELVNYGELDYFEPYQALLAAYPDQVRELLEWALAHRDALTEDQWDPTGAIDTFVVRTLGIVGTAQTADVLRHHYVHDTKLGRDAVEAVHAIEARTQT